MHAAAQGACAQCSAGIAQVLTSYDGYNISSSILAAMGAENNAPGSLSNTTIFLPSDRAIMTDEAFRIFIFGGLSEHNRVTALMAIIWYGALFLNGHLGAYAGGVQTWLGHTLNQPLQLNFTVFDNGSVSTSCNMVPSK